MKAPVESQAGHFPVVYIGVLTPLFGAATFFRPDSVSSRSSLTWAKKSIMDPIWWLRSDFNNPDWPKVVKLFFKIFYILKEFMCDDLIDLKYNFGLDLATKD